MSEIPNRESLRFAYIAEQGYDTSCGLTSLSCLIDKYWGLPTDELSLAKQFLAKKAATGNFTVSFTDMVAILSTKGFSSKAYKMTFEQLEKAVIKYAPVIIHYSKPIGHFALVLSIRDNMVLTSDPSEGTILRERMYFESRWSGNVLVAVRPNQKVNTELLNTAISKGWGRKEILDKAALVEAGSLRW